MLQSGESWTWKNVATAFNPSHDGLKPVATLVVASAVLVALVWRFADSPVTAWAERIQSDSVEAFIRYINRLGGGMNPALIVIFFFVAGVVYRYERWMRYAIAMAIAGAG